MTDIVAETQRLARDTNLTVAEICKAANIKPRWYHKFLASEFKDPGISKVMRLHRALAERKRRAA